MSKKKHQCPIPAIDGDASVPLVKQSDGTHHAVFKFSILPSTKANDLEKLKAVYEIDKEAEETIRILLRRGWSVTAQDITGFELAPPEEHHEDNQHTYH